MTQRPKRVELPSNNLVPIVGNGMIAGPVADGRLIPAVILDTSQRPEVVEMIRVHRHVSPGDVRSVWALIERQPDDVLLMLEFERPVATTVLLRFSIEHGGGLVDMAVKVGGIYLQAGKPGDRLKHDIDRQKILVDLPEGASSKCGRTLSSNG